jgi:hypothetical protein
LSLWRFAVLVSILFVLVALILGVVVVATCATNVINEARFEQGQSDPVKHPDVKIPPGWTYGPVHQMDYEGSTSDVLGREFIAGHMTETECEADLRGEYNWNTGCIEPKFDSAGEPKHGEDIPF